MRECSSCVKDEVSMTLVSKFLLLFLELFKSPLDSKEIKPVNGRTDAEAETPILWPPDAKN